MYSRSAVFFLGFFSNQIIGQIKKYFFVIQLHEGTKITLSVIQRKWSILYFVFATENV
jgi:hypothetical protein